MNFPYEGSTWNETKTHGAQFEGIVGTRYPTKVHRTDFSSTGDDVNRSANITLWAYE